MTALRVGEQAKGRSTVNGWIVAGLMAIATVLLLPAVFDGGVTANRSHADAKHAEAAEIRTRLREGRCHSPIERYFAPTRGTVLLLCQMTADPNGIWGGRVLRIASNGEWLGSRSYEATCMVAHRQYWRWVLRRDGYVPAGGNVIRQLEMLAGL